MAHIKITLGKHHATSALLESCVYQCLAHLVIAQMGHIAALVLQNAWLVQVDTGSILLLSDLSTIFLNINFCGMSFLFILRSYLKIMGS